MEMYIVTSKHCAWRAFYIYSGQKPGYLRFSLGIDPVGNQAELFGAIGWRRDCTGGRKAAWHWRIKLPQSKHWWRLDGRKYSIKPANEDDNG